MSQLDLAIITYKRPKLLRKCLKSIVGQSKKPDRVLVIDNDKLASAKTIVDSFKKQIAIKYVVEKKQGIPYARNRAIRENQAKYLGFVDDDCVLDKDWIKEGLRFIKNKRSAYVVGKTKLENPGNLVAEAQFYHYQQWFLTKLNKKTKQIKAQNLDTKNIIFNMKILNKHKLKFDEMYSLTSIGGGEDVDMGLQIDKLGFNGFYVNKMILKHSEVESFFNFLKKAFYRGRSSYLLISKWQLKDQVVDVNRVNWYRWLRAFWLVPYDNKRISRKINMKRKLIHVLTKIYDRAWIQGYLNQERKF